MHAHEIPIALAETKQSLPVDIVGGEFRSARLTPT
jgi:hypothetical protein